MRRTREGALSDSILVVEDERSIRTIVRYALRDAGFRVLTAARGDEALDVVASEPVDLVVLDIHAPGLDGLEVCKRIPRPSAASRSSCCRRVGGIRQGPRARAGHRATVSAVLPARAGVARQGQPEGARLEPDRTAPLRAGATSRSPTARTVRRGDEEIALTYSEFEILHKLAGSPRRVFTREELMNHLWKGNFYGDLRSVDVHVRHLRRKGRGGAVRADAGSRTVRGVGYAFGGEDGRAPWEPGAPSACRGGWWRRSSPWGSRRAWRSCWWCCRRSSRACRPTAPSARRRRLRTQLRRVERDSTRSAPAPGHGSSRGQLAETLAGGWRSSTRPRSTCSRRRASASPPRSSPHASAGSSAGSRWSPGPRRRRCRRGRGAARRRRPVRRLDRRGAAAQRRRAGEPRSCGDG